MRMFGSFSGLVLVASLGAACSGISSTSPSGPSVGPTVDRLAGAWTLLSVRAASEDEQYTPSGASYTLTFTDGRLTARADCNICNGAYALSGQIITAGPALGCTRAACRTMTFENTYTRLLGGDSVIALSDNRLVLSSDRGVLQFAR